MVTYYYEGLNRRVKKDLATGTDVVYLCDGWQVLEEREWDTNGEGSADDKWEPRRQHVEGGTYIDEHLIFDKDTDDDGDCTDGGGSSRYFYCEQANWNVVAVTGSDATVVEKIKYDPYGEATVTVQGGQSASGNPCLFQGRRWDSETDLYYFRNRVMSPQLGRFLQRDPAGSAQIDLYEFANHNPVRNLDPNGLWHVSWAWGLHWVHRTLTIQGMAAFHFKRITSYELHGGNNYTDYNDVFHYDPANHFIADDSTRQGVRDCFVRSRKRIQERVDLALWFATNCRSAMNSELGKPDFDQGCWGVFVLGIGLHTAQDKSCHRCMTKEQHDHLPDPPPFNCCPPRWTADNPRWHPWRWDASIRDTRTFFMNYWELLAQQNPPWQAREIRCCIEEPCDRKGQE